MLIPVAAWFAVAAVVAIDWLATVLTAFAFCQVAAFWAAIALAAWNALVKFDTRSSIDVKALLSAAAFCVLAISCCWPFWATENSCAFTFENDDWSRATKSMRLFDAMLKMPVPMHPLTAKPRDVIADFTCCGPVVPPSSPQPASAAASMPSTTPLTEKHLFMTVLLGLAHEWRAACMRSQQASPRPRVGRVASGPRATDMPLSHSLLERGTEDSSREIDARRTLS